MLRTLGLSVAQSKATKQRLQVGLELLEGVGEGSIDCQFEGVVKHSGKEGSQELGAFLEAWVCVDLDEPDGKVGVDHEIVAEKLEATVSLLWVKLFLD